MDNIFLYGGGIQNIDELISRCEDLNIKSRSREKLKKMLEVLNNSDKNQILLHDPIKVCNRIHLRLLHSAPNQRNQ